MVEALDLFKETFAPYGLNKDSIVPGYGLAEHCVYVCDGGKSIIDVEKEKLEKEGVVKISSDSLNVCNTHLVSRQISCGFPSYNPDIIVAIVDHSTNKPLENDNVGEIWIDSPSKAHGYFGLEEKSKEDFHATINSEWFDSDEAAKNTTLRDYGKSHSFLRTGDLGFIHDGELYICGRIKDLIIIRGRNHYPQDIEHCAEQNENLRPGCSAAFSLNMADSEALVIVCEVKEDNIPKLDEIAAVIKNSISNEHGVGVYSVVLVKPRTNYKTSSGKIARQRCKASYLD
ncbi:MAG: AMP-binding protein, partial [Actinobacteria bacterium]|nr:AMP-binding protein [Actinomycetota bacterium]